MGRGAGFVLAEQKLCPAYQLLETQDEFTKVKLYSQITMELIFIRFISIGPYNPQVFIILFMFCETKSLNSNLQTK